MNDNASRCSPPFANLSKSMQNRNEKHEPDIQSTIKVYAVLTHSRWIVVYSYREWIPPLQKSAASKL
eukprot:3527118-Pleurochrysis_carterae.AAC.1